MSAKIKETAMAVNKRLERLMPLLAPMGIALGFLLPGVFRHLLPFVPWLFGLITLAGALRLRVAEFGSTMREPLPILAFFVAAHVIMPLGAMLAASFFLAMTLTP